jgi:hypothetical protein
VTNEVLPRLLDSSGVFVLEKRPNEILPETKLWRSVRQKTYGATEVLFLSAIGKEFARQSLGEGG